MMQRVKYLAHLCVFTASILAALLPVISTEAEAVQLDWTGQFWFDHNWLNDYQLSRMRPGNDADSEFVANGTDGYSYIPGAGEKNVAWYSVFFKLKPKLIVNDSINIKSELHLGSPIYGFLGRGYPTTGDERYNFIGSQKGSFNVSAQRFWANLITDFGTVELGRAPINWGFGGIWSSGDGLFDRYQSTGDLVRLTSKFGNFVIQPALVKVGMGNNVAGASTSAGEIIQGNDDVTDYDLAVKYDNTEEDFEFGVMWTKRTGNTSQKTIFFNKNNTASTRINFNIFDFYARKKWGRFWFGGELPYFNGDLGSLDETNQFDYKTFAVLFEGGYTSDLWDINLKAGHVPGQPSTITGDTKFRAVQLNNNYNLGLIMFHYNIAGLARNNPDTVGAANVVSPYDAPFTNATYVALIPELKFEKWSFKVGGIFAWADETAEAGRRFYNYSRRTFNNATKNQLKFLGKEFDFGTSFKWDENFTLSWDLGLYFPGGFYEFSNSPGVSKLETDMMFASQVKVGITF